MTAISFILTIETSSSDPFSTIISALPPLRITRLLQPTLAVIRFSISLSRAIEAASSSSAFSAFETASDEDEPSFMTSFSASAASSWAV